MNFLKDIVAGMATPVASLISEFITDKDQAAKLTFELSKLAADHANALAIAQIAVNKSEAESPSMFKGGWRPFTGWTCALALANNFILVPYTGPLAAWIDPAIIIAPLDLTVMLPVLLGMLGLGYLRTEEKKSGVSK